MPRVYPPLFEGSGGNDGTNQHRSQPVTLSPSLVESVAGFSAGVISTLAVHPFDIVKTRLQIDQNERSRPGGSWQVMRRITREARGEVAAGARGTGLAVGGDSVAVVRAFYRGLMPNMVGNSISWALYFAFYGRTKDLIRSTRPYTRETGARELRSSDYFLASGIAGVVTAVLTNPIWVIKTRMLSTARGAPGAYRSISHGTVTLYREEGLRGFYRGLIPSLFGVSHGAIQFMAYEQLKNHFSHSRENGKAGLTNIDYLSLSALSKIFAGSITYPYQVVRARLQTYDAQAKYNGTLDVVRQVMRKEGLQGFYKGVVSTLR